MNLGQKTPLPPLVTVGSTEKNIMSSSPTVPASYLTVLQGKVVGSVTNRGLNREIHKRKCFWRTRSRCPEERNQQTRVNVCPWRRNTATHPSFCHKSLSPDFSERGCKSRVLSEIWIFMLLGTKNHQPDKAKCPGSNLKKDSIHNFSFTPSKVISLWSVSRIICFRVSFCVSGRENKDLTPRSHC